ncbi:unnamed protein product [Ambrosiozyma monospora]|uniref:Unnamed protein product n=1 Tax=Ambrosiozyma monospora TaxID=43982 RepID=A0ACB5TW22_AMBMO|nr:unnamed protein product [Ambrosiozyma monospora]
MFGFNVNPLLLTLLISARLIFAIKGVIQDCDEVYNYWEPLNFLTRYFGKQTWEYSPEYAIRSWTYLIPFGLITYPLRLLESTSDSLFIPSNFHFYLVRIFIGLVCTYAELNLAESLKFLSDEISNWFLIFEIFNPGMSHASISLLPSSFTLIMGMFATAAVINYFK